LGIDPPRPPQESQRPVGRFFGERAECRPLATDQRVHREGVLCVRLQHLDAVLARDQTGELFVRAGQRAHAAEMEDDLRPIEGDSGQDVPREMEEVINLLVRADSFVRVVNEQIGCADNHLVAQWQHNAHAPVFVLEVERPAVERPPQLWMPDDDV